jgi:hypothetical protein
LKGEGKGEGKGGEWEMMGEKESKGRAAFVDSSHDRVIVPSNPDLPEIPDIRYM